MSKIIPVYRNLSAGEFETGGYADRVLSLEAELFPEEERWDSREDFCSVIAHPDMVRISAELGDSLIGFGMGIPILGKDGKTGGAREIYVNDDGSPSDKIELVPDNGFLLWGIAVAKLYKGRRVGRNLFDRFVEHAEESGAKGLYAYFREKPRKGKRIRIIAPVDNYADTGKTYYLCEVR